MIGDLIIDEYSFEEDREFPPQQHNEPMSEEQLNYYEQLFMNIYNEEKTLIFILPID